MKISKYQEKGFTLIEVVVVMAIIAVLATLVVGGIVIARRMANDTQKINDLKTLQATITSYNTKTHEWPENTNEPYFCYVGKEGASGTVCLHELVDADMLSELPKAPGFSDDNDNPANNYFYYQYNSFILIATEMDNKQKGPGTDGWNCTWEDSPEGWFPYCINWDK